MINTIKIPFSGHRNFMLIIALSSTKLDKIIIMRDEVGFFGQLDKRGGGGSKYPNLHDIFY